MNPVATRERTNETISAHGTAWHTIAAAQALARLEADGSGLDARQVATRLERFGRNTFPKREAASLVSIILHQFKSPLIYILLAAGAVAFALGEIAETLFILLVVGLNAALGAFQEWRAEQSAAALQNMMRVAARVRRDGAEREADAEELVPGDIVLLESGARVPADLRLLDANNLKIDESFLTGESLAVDKDAAAVVAPDAPVGDRFNMAYAGATVLAGRGRGVVTETGLATELGKVARATTEAQAAKPPLVIRMEQFVHNITYVILAAVGLLAVISFWRGTPVTEVFFIAVALAVSAIPEGLPVAMTVALSVGVSRMARRNVIVRKMTAVEGLGSCTLIGSDKTGTLTVNKQTVRLVELPDGRRYEVTGEGYAGEGEVLPAAEAAGGKEMNTPAATPDADGRERLRALAEAAVVCNEATLADENGEWKHAGDAVDVALLAFGYKAGVDARQVKNQIEVVGEIPFESERKFAATLYRKDGRTKIAVKGAVETVLDFCADGDGERLDKAAAQDAALRLAGEGLRVIAVAHAEVTDAAGEVTSRFDENNLPPLRFAGLVGMIDPLRPEAKAAIEKCKGAGVEVAMITGDHPATALAIARELGLAEREDELATGQELARLADDPHEFERRVARTRVFARVAPLQKLHIVEAFRRKGHFVAVTGDGVNDAPAMRAAEIGVAMGSGTDVAKDAASIIVTDDNFASLERGVEEGRFAYDNIRKVIYLLISAGAAELLLFILAIFAGLPLPLLPVQILWLNLVTNGIQDVALAFEGGEPGAMQRPPRAPAEGVFDRLMISQTLLAGATMGLVSFGVWVWLLRSGVEEAAARNLVLLLMVLFQNYHVFNCRSERVSAFRVPLRRNPVLILGVGAALGLHLLAMNLGFMQTVLRVAPVSANEFFILLALASSVLVVLELFKLLRAGGVERRTATVT